MSKHEIRDIAQSSGRSHLTREGKARRRAERELKAAFRKANGLGSRGRLLVEYQNKLDRFLEKHLDAAAKALEREG